MLEAIELDKAKSMIEAKELWESRLLALECVLLAICEEHGIDPDAVRRLSGTETFPMRSKLAVDAEYQADMQTNFARLLMQ